MNKNTTAQDRQDVARVIRDRLLSGVATQRENLGLTKVELAERIGRNRATVQRAEAEDSGVGISLTSFCELAVGVGLTTLTQTDDRSGHPDVMTLAPHDIVHRGRSHYRTKSEPQWRDRQRERALACAWEAENDFSVLPVDSVMADLIPNHTQEEATAVATAIQWLGTEVGFVFLTKTLEKAGYAVVDTKDKSAAKRKR
jgi:hypothetical protein